LDFRQGFFRLWLLLSGIWILVVIAGSYRDLADEFHRAYYSPPPGFIYLYPVPCDETRGIEGTDYTKGRAQACWYKSPKFRQLYPEYKDQKTFSRFNREADPQSWHATPLRSWYQNKKE